MVNGSSAKNFPSFNAENAPMKRTSGRFARAMHECLIVCTAGFCYGKKRVNPVRINADYSVISRRPHGAACSDSTGGSRDRSECDRTEEERRCATTVRTGAARGNLGKRDARALDVHAAARPA